MIINHIIYMYIIKLLDMEVAAAHIDLFHHSDKR